MKLLLKTNDVVMISYVRSVLDEHDIAVFELDVNMSVLEGSIGILPRRIMVADQHHRQAERLLELAGIIIETDGYARNAG